MLFIFKLRYSRVNNELFQCVKCAKNLVQLVILFSLQAGITVYLVWCVKKGLDRSKQIVMADLMRKLSLVSLGRNSQVSSTSAFIKIIAHYVQVISSLKYYHPQYPSFGLLYADYLGDPIDKATFAFDCILTNFSDLGIPFEYLKIIWSSFYQLIYLIIYLAIYFLLIKIKRVEYKYAARNAIIFFVLFIQNSIISQLVSALSCRTIGLKSYNHFAISKECYTPTFYAYSYLLVIPLLVLWGVVIPGCGFYILFGIRKKLFTLFNTLNYGLLFLEYKPFIFYWEFIKMTEKILLIFAVNYFLHNLYYQAISSVLLIMTYSKLFNRLSPYKDAYFNNLEKQSSIIQIIFFFLILIQADLTGFSRVLLTWIIVFVNLSFLLYLFYQTISYQVTLHEVYLTLSRIPCLRRYISKNLLPAQPQILNTHLLWRSLSIYVKDFAQRRRLDKKAPFYIKSLQIGGGTHICRVSQLKTSQQLRAIQNKSNLSFSQDRLSRLNKESNDIPTESRILTKFCAISEENQEEENQSQLDNTHFNNKLISKNRYQKYDRNPNNSQVQIPQFETKTDEESDNLKSQMSFSQFTRSGNDGTLQKSFINHPIQSSINQPIQSSILLPSNIELTNSSTIQTNLNLRGNILIPFQLPDEDNICQDVPFPTPLFQPPQNESKP